MIFREWKNVEGVNNGGLKWRPNHKYCLIREMESYQKQYTVSGEDIFKMIVLYKGIY